MHANTDLYYAIHRPVYICIHSHKYFHETASPTHNQFRVPSYVAFPDVLLQHVLHGNSIQCLCQVQLCHTLYSLATIIISIQIKYFGEACGRLDPPIRNSISCIKLDHASVVQLTKTKTKKHFSKAYFNKT